MKKFLSLFLVMYLAAGIVAAQKVYNDVNAEIRSISGFHGIDVATGITLYLSEGNTEQVAVSADKTGHRDKIVTEVENGILRIHYKTKTGSVNKMKESKNLKAYVSYKTLDKLCATTGAEVKINGVLKGVSFDMKANTGALIDGDIAIENLMLDQNTGSRVTLSGKATTLKAGGSTGSKLMGEGLLTAICHVNVNTGAKVWIQAEKELQAKASTGAQVRYKGAASVKEIKTNTGGEVSAI
jgi:hypothetical protein